jgi:DNA-directed RNA polymerase specialized sigma24 family protein
MGESAPLSRQYLDGISEQERLIVIMRHVLGYAVDEIAALTASPENAVKIRLLRARDVMRRMCRREQLLFEVSRCRVED